ncbi:MAG: hypothetical protein JWP48_2271 [Actinoallomurus sp.]|jgi:hypothetical protein|nr:hypothetical protein [Actinoallomurus sp.]
MWRIRASTGGRTSAPSGRPRTRPWSSHQICVWFSFPEDGQNAAAPQTATATDVRPLSADAPAAASST